MSLLRRSSGSDRAGRGARLSLEPLEPRVLLSGLTWYVDDTAAGANNGTSWADAFTDLQAALTAANDDQVWVAAGTYTPTSGTDRTVSFELTNGVEIYGGFPDGGGAWGDRDWNTHVATLSGDLNGDDAADFANRDDNSYHVVYTDGQDATAVLDGFTISGGSAYGPSSGYHKRGGGVKIIASDATLRNLTLTGNQSEGFGGGIYLFNSNAAIIDCTFSGNQSERGGAIYCPSTLTITGCTFTGNSALHGGAVFVSSNHPTLSDALFEDNTATGMGGGIYVEYSGVTVTDSRFVGNEAAGGGGIGSLSGDVDLVDVSFVGNAATYNGGGLMVEGSGVVSVVNASFLGNESGGGGGVYLNNQDAVGLTNVVFSGNEVTGGGGALVANSCPITVSNVTASANTAQFGGGFYFSSATVDLRNSILWGNTATANYDQVYTSGGTLTIQYSDVEGGWAGTGNIDADPLFVDADGADNDVGTADDDLRTGPTSPAIGTGSNALVPADVADLDGDLDTAEVLPYDLDDNARVFDATVDMGAYENQDPNHAPVLDTSGAPALDGLAEDPVANDGILVSDLIARLGGTGITDADAGALEGIAITGAEGVGGVWQYSTNGATTWTSIYGVSDASAIVLGDGADDRIRFSPYADWNGASTVTFRAWDRAEGRASGTADVDVSRNGGATPFSAEAETASITVTPVEDAPTAGFGKALAFDPATNDAVSTGSRSGIAFAGDEDFTVAMWVHHAGTGSQGLYDQDRNGNGEFGYGIFLNADGRLTQSVDVGGMNVQWGSTVIPTGQWTHIAWVKEGSTFRLYVDGELAESGGGPSPAGRAPTASLRLGSSSGSTLDGQMDEVSVWATAFDASDIQTLLYQRPDASHPEYASLRAHWAFDDGSGTTAVDSAGGDNNGTLLGATTGPAWVDSTIRTWPGQENLEIDGQAIGGDADGDTLTFAKASDPAHGSVTVNPDGTFTYTPGLNWTGDDSFTYTVDDGHGSPATGTTWVTVAPRFHIAATDPADGANVTLDGDLVLTVDFNHDVDPTTIGTDDLTVSTGTVTNAVASDADTAVYTISGLASEGAVTYDFAAAALADTGALAMDAYSGSVTTEFGTLAYPTPLAAERPLGSLIYDPSVDASLLDGADTDAFTLVLDPGQTLTVVLEAGDPGLQAHLDVAGPGGALATGQADAAGENIVVNGVPVATAGTYTVTVSSLAGSGDYQLRVILNADQELEDVADAANSNDALATAQDIDASFLELGGGMGRGGVLGTFDTDTAVISYSAEAVAYTFEDISGTGTVTLEDEDDEYAELTSGDLGDFEFPFYGTTYTSLYFSSNGLITFMYDCTDTGGYDLTDEPDYPSIAVLWDDLYVENDTSPYGVYWEVRGSGDDERLIIQWHNVRFYSGPSDDPLVFQAVLYGNGNIQLNYADLTGGNTDYDEGADATVGIKDADDQGPDRLLLAYEDGPNAYVGSGQSTLISLIPPTLGVDCYALTLEAGEPATLALTASGSTYGATLELLDPAGTVVATGATGPTNVGWVIDRYAPATDGAYTARVSGIGVGYSLVAVTGGALDQEPNGDLANAQDISGSVLPVLGIVDPGAAPLDAEFEANDDGVLEGDVMSAADAAAANSLVGDFVDAGGGVWQSEVDAYLEAGGEDFFWFYAPDGTVATIEVQPRDGSDWDSYLEVFDSTFSEIATNDDGGVDAFSKLTDETLTGSPDEIYYVKVEGYDASEEGEYTLAVTLDAAQPVVPPGSDFYAFTVAEGDEITLWTQLPGGGAGQFVNNLDPYLRLYDPAGTLIAEDDNSGEGANAQIQRTVAGGEEGVWTVEVSAVGNEGGEYVLLVDQVAAGPLEVARLADGQVILYDADATSELDADVAAADVRITLDSNGAVKHVRIVGNSTGFGMLVMPHGDRRVKVDDRRDASAGPLEPLAFVCTSGPAAYIRLDSVVAGAAMGTTLETEGVVADPDLDGDGATNDPTAVYTGGPVDQLRIEGAVGGDLVVLGAKANGKAIGKLRVAGGDLLAGLVTPGGGVGRLTVHDGVFRGNAAINGSVARVRLLGGANDAVLDIAGDLNHFRSYGPFDSSELLVGGDAGTVRFDGALTPGSNVGLGGQARRLDFRGPVAAGAQVAVGNVGKAHFRGPVLADVAFANDLTGTVWFHEGMGAAGSLALAGDLAGRVVCEAPLEAPVQVDGDLTGLLTAPLFNDDVTVSGDFTGAVGLRPLNGRMLRSNLRLSASVLGVARRRFLTENGPATLFLTSAGQVVDGWVARDPGSYVHVVAEDLGFGGAFAAIDDLSV